MDVPQGQRRHSQARRQSGQDKPWLLPHSSPMDSYNKYYFPRALSPIDETHLFGHAGEKMVELSPRHPLEESSPGGPATPSSPEAKKIE